MRAGGFTIQQALSPDAATIIKQAITLARRRGHAQVTPLHVANTMLSAANGLLLTACLQSHSHPLRCKALELCFNVALNRLPASSSGPILGPHHHQHPTISNALVAAFKRAQAHQRRGSIENQQQPLLAVKIELEQLIISILDDPSVSRVMREAGFSSTQVKSNVEQVVSLELSSTTTTIKSKEGAKTNTSDQVIVRNEDVICVIDNILNKKRSRNNLVVVGECVAILEAVVGRVMEKVEKGEVPEGLRDFKFITFPLFSFSQLSRGEIEQKVGELRSMVKGFLQKGVVVYLGDLKWISEYKVNSWGQGRSYYCPVEHLILELGRLVGGINEEMSGKFSILGIASFQTYMRCRSGDPSLEIVWKLHPLTIPAASLSLSLIPESDIQSECGSKNVGNGASWLMLESREENQLTCCADCSANFESEAKSSRNNASCRSSSLPSWLKDEKTLRNNNDQECVPVQELCKKWNSICTSAHRNKPFFGRSLSFSSISPTSSTSCFSYDQYNDPSSIPTLKERQFWDFSAPDRTCEPSLSICIPHDRGDRPSLKYSSNPNSTPNSASSSDLMEVEYVQRFKEFNAENLKIICNALEEKVPWQKDIIPDIASTILQCRSGMLRRKEKQRCFNNGEPKEETWFFFQGIDSQSKEKVARELAKVVFGSYSNFVAIALSNFSSSTRADSMEDLRNKRSRDEQSYSYIERFAEAVSVNPHRVFLVEDVEQADYCSQMRLLRAIERGKLTNSNGEEVGFADAIVVLSCESFSSRSRACSPPGKQKGQDDQEESGLRSPEEAIGHCVLLDLNISFDEDHEEEQIIDDLGLLESVDRCINFKIQDL